MRVAALYDVHGNIRALEAVLAEVPADAAILVGGDVAAGPFPQQTVDRLRALGGRVDWIRGNADRELMPGEQGLAPAETMQWLRERIDYPFEWPSASREEAVSFFEARAVGS